MSIIVINKSLVMPAPEWIYIGRPSVLGNPYSHRNISGTIRVGSLEESIEAYSNWLREEFRKKRDVYWEIMRLVRAYQRYKKLTLVCWCKPNPCHGDFLGNAIQTLASHPDYCLPEDMDN